MNDTNDTNDFESVVYSWFHSIIDEEALGDRGVWVYVTNGIVQTGWYEDDDMATFELANPTFCDEVVAHFRRVGVPLVGNDR